MKIELSNYQTLSQRTELAVLMTRFVLLAANETFVIRFC